MAKRTQSAKKSKKTVALPKPSPWLTDVWPTERDIMIRPDRLKYVRKLIKVDGCVFCNAHKAGKGFKSLLLHKGRNASVMMNKFPYNPGHLLIIPNRHVGEFTELKKGELYELQDLIKLSLKVLREAYDPSGFNVGLNLGAAAGAGIPDHIHYHIVPRWKGDTNFFPLLAETKVIVEDLEATFDRLLPLFKELNDE
jgi:ATP adenylyltransferase